MPRMPTRRSEVRGRDLDGHAITLILSVARKLYVCPSCRATIEIGSEHVLVKRAEPGGDSYHQHWHSVCAEALARELEIAGGLDS